MAVTALVIFLAEVAAGLVAINTIISESDKYYENVNRTLEKINEISGGEFNEQLVETANKLERLYKELIEGLRKLADAVQAIYDKYSKSDKDSAGKLKGANSKYN